MLQKYRDENTLANQDLDTSNFQVQLLSTNYDRKKLHFDDDGKHISNPYVECVKFTLVKYACEEFMGVPYMTLLKENRRFINLLEGRLKSVEDAPTSSLVYHQTYTMILNLAIKKYKDQRLKTLMLSWMQQSYTQDEVMFATKLGM